MKLALLALPRQIAGAFAVAVTVALGSAVFAPLSNAAGPAPDHAPPHVMTVAAQKSVDGRINSLHQRLGITPAQESLWQRVSQIMRDNANAMESLRKARCQQQLRSDPLGPLCSTLDLTHLGHQVDAQHVA
ncbi:Spy/CpxP family protein refolding chaperone [Burkholderia multivorans]|uniref:Spy/CpxP family protein refolding chaperone n=1 Tax=Burkholderia multivorans TaxID=87883 RepID=UPI0009E0CE5E|nr:Spy/CpxP family protein refolding chaperone [Burkholderia multivorans]SAJ95677.1 LTXXQ motif family protein [Burkholderia multivorans]